MASAMLVCTQPSCSLCTSTGEAVCGLCRKLICWPCAAGHCAACVAAAKAQPGPRTGADYEDSPRSMTATQPLTPAAASEDLCESADEGFFGKVDLLWHAPGHGELGEGVLGRLHRLPIMSRASIYEAALGTWRFFGDVVTMQFLAEQLQWELSSGIIVLHSGAKTCLCFRHGQEVESLEPQEAVKLAVANAGACLCLVVATAEGGLEEGHLEVQQTFGDKRTLLRQRAALDKMLRALISNYDVAFWRPESEWASPW